MPPPPTTGGNHAQARHGHQAKTTADTTDPYWSPAFSRQGQQYLSRGSRYRSRRQVTFRRNSQVSFLWNAGLATGRRFWIVWGAISVVTVGLATPIPTIIAWVRSRQSRRRPDVLGSASRFWLISAVVWTVITALVLVGYVAAGSTSGGSTTYQPPAIHSVSLGTPFTVREGGITEKFSETREPVTVTVTGVDRATPGVAKVQFSVCADGVALDPLSAAFRLAINGPDGTNFGPRTPTNLPDAWYQQLPAHRCLTAAVPFAVPSPDIISNVTFGIDEQVVWPAS